MRADVIVNTTARRFRQGSNLQRFARACAGRAELHPTSSLAELDQVMIGCAQRGTDLVVFAGGDGTFMAGATSLVRAFGELDLPRVALVPGGTAATVARNWTHAGDAIDVLERVLSQGVAAEAVTRPTLRVRADEPGGTVERVGFIFGTGLVAKFFDVYYARGATGYAGAAAIVARVFAESFVGGPFARTILDPLPCSITAEGRRLPHPAWSLVCASVIPNLGLGMRVTYRAGEDPDRIHLVASPLSTQRLGPRAPLVLMGRSIGGAGHFDDLVRDFEVSFEEVPEGIGPYVLDGDPLRARKIRVSPGPALEILTAGVLARSWVPRAG